MNRKRVLWLSHFLPWPPDGGLKLRSYNLIRELSQYHDIQLIAFWQKAHQGTPERVRDAVAELSRYVRVRSVFPLLEDSLRFGRERTALRSLLPGDPYTVRWGYSQSYGQAIRVAIDEFAPEIVHFDTIALAQYAELANGKCRTLTHHNIESHMLERRSTLERNIAKRCFYYQEAWRLARYERLHANQFSAHLLCSDLEVDRLRARIGRVPAFVVPNSVDLEFFRPSDQQVVGDLASVIFVGGLSWYPNASAVRFLINEVWPKVLSREPDAILRIVGRGAPTDVVDMASRTKNVVLLGYVEDIRPLVQRATVYACPIFDGGGTKLKMLDAMAMGKAIVAHPVACEGLKLTPGVDVTVAESAYEFSDQIVELMQNQSRRSDLEGAARRHVGRHFSSRIVGLEMAQLYSNLPVSVRVGDQG